MGIKDVIKNSFIQNFEIGISRNDIILTFIMAFIFTIFVFYVYKLTSKEVIYSKKFNVTMALMSIITTGVVLSMQANIVVSLGMVGALSIVRFRTAIKEPRDLLFLFWSISNGIIIGANLYVIAFVLALVLVITMIILEKLPDKKLPYILVLNLDKESSNEEIIDIFNKKEVKYIIKSKNISQGKISIVYELMIKEDKNILEDINNVSGVSYINLIKQDDEFKI